MAFIRQDWWQRRSLRLAVGLGLLVGLGGLGGVFWHGYRRDRACKTEPLLTDIAVGGYDSHGIKRQGATFARWIPVNPQRPTETKIPLIVSPAALSEDLWQPVSADDIYYLGQGGERDWHDRLMPDHFYLVNIPESATALAFSRLCYRDKDVGFDPNVTLVSVSEASSATGALTEILINEHIYIQSVVVPKRVKDFPILANTGSDKRDVLGVSPQVYYTVQAPFPRKAF